MLQRWCSVVNRSRILSSVSTLPFNSSSTKIISSKVIMPAFCALRALSSNTKVTHSQIVNGGEVVHVLTLNKLSDNPGAVKKKRRVGRGVGSSKGKTCGRGHKGQKARSNPGIHPGFEGGQTKLYKRIPKRGFTNIHATPMLALNLGTLQDFVDMGRLIPPKPDEPALNLKDLVEAGIAKNSSIKHGMKLLAKGKERLRTPLKLEVSRASRAAIEALEAVGGEVTTVHYNRLALRVLLKPHKFQVIPKFAAPPPKLLPYYTNYENRGYLSPEVQKRKLKELQQK